MVWRGERIHAQLFLVSDVRLEGLTVETEPLQGTRDTLPADAIRIGQEGYVLTDGLNDEGGGCGITPERQAAARSVADPIFPTVGEHLEANCVLPLWLSIRIPRQAEPGLYQGAVTIKTAKGVCRLPYTVEVKERQLPEPHEWRFHLDLWQNPYSIARYYGVPAWSEEHFERMKPHMEMLADAGQKAITVSMIHDPWRGQTYDIYESMIRWIRHADGTWSYDYTIFDRWVGFMESLGIDRLINCYTMVPWNDRFHYYDEAAGRDTVLVAKVGTPEFAAHWRPMLKDFARHLRATGRFEKTAIAMDERPLDAMLAVIGLVKSVDPEFRISLAGNYHAEIALDIHDYSIASSQHYPSEVLEARDAAGRPSTFYTCCAEGFPNTFTFSPPAEAAWMGWFAAAKGYSGYLRWAYNCWPQDPIRDSRFGTWSGGDTYLVYPGPLSSLRFELLVEGIQAYEKIRLLQEEFARHADREASARLRQALEAFDLTKLRDTPAAEAIRHAKEIINNY